MRAAAESSTAAAPAADYEEVSQSTLQKTMARRMAESKASVPHLYAGIKIRMTKLMALRGSIKAVGSSATVTILSFVP